MMRIRLASLAAAVLIVLATISSAAAQAPETTPAFALFSDHVFSTRENPSIGLTFRRVDHLDLRI